MRVPQPQGVCVCTSRTRVSWRDGPASHDRSFFRPQLRHSFCAHKFSYFSISPVAQIAACRCVTWPMKMLRSLLLLQLINLLGKRCTSVFNSFSSLSTLLFSCLKSISWDADRNSPFFISYSAYSFSVQMFSHFQGGKWQKLKVFQLDISFWCQK